MELLPKCGTRSYVLYYILISIVYLQMSHFLSSAGIETTVCETPECKQLGEYYKKIMKHGGNPCSDFYDFVCHDHLNSTAISNIRKLLEENRKNDIKITKKLALTHLILSAKTLLQTQISESKWVNGSLKKAWRQFYGHLHNVEETATAGGINLIHNNTIGVSAAYLQWPMYDANLPPVIQYGALISTVGRGLYHGFNYTGLDTNFFDFRYNKNYRQHFKMLEAFNNVLQCFTDSYNKTRISLNKPDPQKDPDLPLIVNEVIPDVMGLKLAYRAYKHESSISTHPSSAASSMWGKVKKSFQNWMHPQKESKIENCIVLPGLPNYSCEQLFFIAYASSLCVNSSPIPEANTSLNDDQSIRVNFAVASIPEFQEAFKCNIMPSALTKSPHEQCDLWN